MPRQPRLVVRDLALHVTQRGNNRQACFREESDYLVYLHELYDLLGKAGCALHAYCLMTNHVHLLLTPSREQSCAILMRELGPRYVQYFNRRHGRSGTLWEGRFRSCLVDSAAYVLACYRYIELNPVRAGLCASPEGYRWSSHNGNVGDSHNKLLAPHPEYLALGGEKAARYAAYRQLFQVSDEPGFLAAVRDATNGGYALVSDQLKASLSLSRRMERGKPGPKPDPVSAKDPGTAELGL